MTNAFIFVAHFVIRHYTDNIAAQMTIRRSGMARTGRVLSAQLLRLAGSARTACIISVINVLKRTKLKANTGISEK